MSESTYLVSLNISPLLEEAIIDCLLALESEHNFSTQCINAHSNDHQHLSLAEQVAGRKQQIRVQIYVSETEKKLLIEQLQQQFSGSGVQYWVLPVLESGYI